MQPDFKIQVVDQHQDITERVRDRLVELRVIDTIDTTSDYIELELDDAGGKLRLHETGAKLRVEIGYKGASLISKGTYNYDEVGLQGPPSRMIIRARAANFLSAMKAPRTRAWHEKTLGEIVSTIAEEHGYKARVMEPDYTNAAGKPAWYIEHVDQTGESDLVLMHRLARHFDAVFKVRDLQMYLLPRGEDSKALMPVIDLSPGNVTRWDVRLLGRPKYGAVRAFWRDIEAAKTESVMVGDGEPVFEVRHPSPTREAAEAYAKACLARLQRREGALSLTMPGLPILKSLARLNLKGFRSGVDGEWVISRVEHTISKRGYRCTVKGELA